MASIKLALATDANNPTAGDLFLDANSNLAMTSTLSEEVAQLLYTRFRFFQGEWFLDPTLGVPWFQSILGQKIPIAIVSQILQSVVSTCPGVASVDSLTLTQVSGRNYQAVFSCTLSDGTTLTSSDFLPFVIGSV